MHRHEEGPRWPDLRRRVLIALAVVGVVVVGAGVIVAAFIRSLANDFDNGRQVIASASAFPAPNLRAPQAQGAAQNILLLGSDSNGAKPASLDAVRGQRSDTMMLVHVPADRKHLYVISILRDSWVTVPGHGQAKINAALAYGGVPLVIQTLENLTHVRIDHVAIVSFSGFSGLTDALGGVVVDNSVPFAIGGERFPVGLQRLDGKRALLFVRARHPFPDGDYQRVRNQQAYLKGVVRTVLTPGTLLDPLKVTNTVKAISPYLLVDEGLNSGYAGPMAVSLRSLRSSDIRFFSMPTTGTSTVGAQSVVLLDQPRLAQLAQLLRADQVDRFTPCSGDTC